MRSFLQEEWLLREVGASMVSEIAHIHAGANMAEK
jgi:hypothetical protein